MAARLEGLAGPGGIACSAVVRDQVGNKLELEFLDQGEKTVKNIAQPVHVYFVNLAAPANGSLKTTVGAQPRPRPDKPSVAILPFANMSNDPEREFFSDGITEDIITDLSNVSGLFVLGRNTVFTYKGKAVNLERIAKGLGVAYVVEGSVRKAGNRVRINAQLIEGATGGHLWADRYEIDRSIDLLEVCLQQFGIEMKLWFKNDSDLDPIRNHPRYQARRIAIAGRNLRDSKDPASRQAPRPYWRNRAFQTALLAQGGNDFPFTQLTHSGPS